MLRASSLALLLTLTSSPEQQAPPPGFSIAFAFEPRVRSHGAINPKLRTYGFAPTGSPLLITYGLRARAWTRRGWILGGAMSYGFARRDDEGNPVPTTISLIETTFEGGHQLGAGFDALLGVGFSVTSMSVGSSAMGGALVYMGPVIQPRVGWTAPLEHAFLRLSVGYELALPVGAPHDQALWEASFRQVPIHGFVVGIESGYVAGRTRWRWRDRAKRGSR